MEAWSQVPPLDHPTTTTIHLQPELATHSEETPPASHSPTGVDVGQLHFTHTGAQTLPQTGPGGQVGPAPCWLEEQFPS